MSYQAVILTVSDSCAAGTRTDTSGPAIRAIPVAMWVEGLKSTPRRSTRCGKSRSTRSSAPAA